jgi:hypothetical protein
MGQTLSLPRPDDLKAMPLRAIVAFAVRCARRAQPSFRLVTDIADFVQHEAAVEQAISLAERFCVGDESESYTLAAAADAAAYAGDAVAYAATDAAARAFAVTRAFAAASSAAAAARAAAARGAVARAAAADAAADDATAAAARDFQTLVKLFPRGWFGREAANGPIDPSEDGPFGPLWPPPAATADSGRASRIDYCPCGERPIVAAGETPSGAWPEAAALTALVDA